MSGNNKQPNITGKPKPAGGPTPAKKQRNKRAKNKKSGTGPSARPPMAPKSNVKAMQQFARAVKKFQNEREFCYKVIYNLMSLERDYLYPRSEPTPACSKNLDAYIKIDPTYISPAGEVAMQIHPNPDRTLGLARPPTVTSGIAKDERETMVIQTFQENGINMYFDKDITLQVGSLTANTVTVTGLPGGTYYADGDKRFRDGTKVYHTSGPFTAGGAWTVSYDNKGGSTVNVDAAIYIIQKQGANLVVGATGTVNFNANNFSFGSALLQNWAAVAAAAAAPETYGFALSFTPHIQGEDNINNNSNAYGLEWDLSQGNVSKPNFSSAYTWTFFSMWELKGAAYNGLKEEWSKADRVSVTGLNWNLANTTAVLNINGDMNGTIIPRGKAYDPPAQPSLVYRVVDDTPANYLRMREPLKAGNGCHGFMPIDDEDAKWYPRDRSAIDVITQDYQLRPFALIAVLATAPVGVASLSLRLDIRMHIEWITRSLTLTPHVPPHNVAFFAATYNRIISEEVPSVWTENPSHVPKLKSMAKTVVNSKLFKTVLRDVATVGLESLATILM